MREFQRNHIEPARERVQANPDSLWQELKELIKASKTHFKSKARGRPGNKEALCVLALERLEEQLKDMDIAQKVLGDWERRGSQYWMARLILYPLNAWSKYTQSVGSRGFTHVLQPGFVDYVRSQVRYSPFTKAPPEPPPSGDAAVEIDLETKVLKAEAELEGLKAALRSYREAKEKAAQEQAERERVAKEKAEQRSRERSERERVEREAMERADSERRAQEQSSDGESSVPLWALILELTPPFTEDQVRTAYGRKVELTNHDQGGTDKEFQEIDSAYETAMRYCRSLGHESCD
jgi:hypothetical protein